MNTIAPFVGLVGFVALQRLVELAVARRNEREARSRGAFEVGAGHYPSMVALHTLFLVGVACEAVFLKPPFRHGLAAAMLVLLVVASALRAWVIRTLGWRWTTRILVVPGLAPVTRGPFRLMRHPNYLAVAIEMAALPLVHGAWRSALLFSALNGALMIVRIRSEEKALDEEGRYHDVFALARKGDSR